MRIRTFLACSANLSLFSARNPPFGAAFTLLCFALIRARYRIATNTLNFALPSRKAVDEMYAELTSAGYAGHLAPIDAFWGQRFAIVDDPDGNIIGLQSPREG